MAQVTPRSTVEAAVKPIHQKPRPWPWPLSLYQTYTGKKWAMAITGVIGLLFIGGHMFGNLKLYMGAAEIDAYAIGLREVAYPLVPKGFLLWIARIGLLVAVVVHIHSAWSILVHNRKARPVKYAGKRDYIAADWASRTMQWTGPIILLFIAFHLSDLTWGFANPAFEHGDVYANTIASFQRLPVAALYIVANLALGVHIYHGAWSLFQSLGVNNPQYNALRRLFAIGFALAIVAGNISFPVAVTLGILE